MLVWDADGQRSDSLQPRQIPHSSSVLTRLIPLCSPLSLLVAAALRSRHRIVGECGDWLVQPVRVARKIRREGPATAADPPPTATSLEEDEESAVDKEAALSEEADDDADPVPAQYPHLPVHLSLPQASLLLAAALVRLADGCSFAALRLRRFPSVGVEERSPASVLERRAALTTQRQRQLHTREAHGRDGGQWSNPQHATAEDNAQTQAARPTPSPYPLTSTAGLAMSLLGGSPSSFTAVTAIACREVDQRLADGSSPPSIPPPLVLPPSPRPLSLVFADLHSRGFTVTSGVQYGGDFLLYDGDPSECHAHSVVRVLRDAVQGSAAALPLSAMDVLTMARVASGARKSVVVASVSDSGSPAPVSYATWRWEPGVSRGEGARA